MTSQLGIATVQAIPQATQDDGSLQTQAAQAHAKAMADQALLAQQFETTLTRASELAALTFQAAEETRRRAPEIQRERQSFQTSDIPEVEVRPAPHTRNIGKAVTEYLDGFSHRANDLVSAVEEIATKVEKPSPIRTASLGSSLPQKAADAGITPAEALRLTVASFNFAMEAHLISNAATQSTGIFNSLMKGQ